MSTISTSSTSSTSSSSSSTIQNGRYWGLASGLDVDSIVTSLVSKQQEKIDKAKQTEQKLEWKQDAYRDIISKLTAFESAYLEMGQSTSLAAADMYKSFSCTSSNSYITASANSDASGEIQSIIVKQSATTASLTGSSIGDSVKSGVSLDKALLNLKEFASDAEKYGDADPSMTVTVDGVSKSISFSSDDLEDVSDASGLVDLINDKLTSAFGQVASTDGSGTKVTKVLASLGTDGTLVLSANGGYSTQFSLSATSSSFDAKMLGAAADAAQRNSTANPTMSVTFGGVTKTLEFSSSDDLSASGLLATIDTKLSEAFSGKGLAASFADNGSLVIQDASDTAATYSASNTSFNALDALDMTSGVNNRLNVNSTTLGDFLTSKGVTAQTAADGNIYATINGVSVKLGTADTELSDVFSNINKSDAGVTIAYNKTLDSVSLTADQSGTAGKVDISGDTSGLFTAMNFSDTTSQGRDAIVNINGTDYTRDTNSFTIDGVTYGIQNTVDPGSSESSTITFTKDTSKLEEGLENFISAYNTLIDAIHTQVNTAPDSDYPPLTDSQKSEMTDTQITEWNEKAKAGMLYGDDTLTSIVDNMRELLYEPVTTSDGSTISLYDIGITTSDDADDYGKLEIKTEDEQTFEDAIANNADKIKDLFTQSSDILLDISPTTTEGVEQQQLRRQQEGITSRLDDIIEGAAGSVSGSKGTLLTIAGQSGDSTQYNNSIYSQLEDLNTSISDLQTELKTQKNRYYSQFEQLETYMEEANTQSSYLSNMFASD